MILQELSGDVPAPPGFYFPGNSTAGNAKEVALFRAPFRCQIQQVSFVASANITGAATNNFALNVRNRGAAGSGTAVPATLTFGNGTNAVAQVPLDLTLSSTASDLVLAAGDVLTAEKAVNGTGLAAPDGLIVVRFRSY